MAVARTHVPRYNPDRCMPCGTCTRHCPATVFPHQLQEADSLRAIVPRMVDFPKAPEGSQEPWRADVPPCQAACPLGQDVSGYVSAIARGDENLALEIIRRDNPLPSTCGRLCPAGCMDACVRASIDESVNIRSLKRFAVDQADNPDDPAWPKPEPRALSVAVIGSGPAGLAGAWKLALSGWQVAIYEADEKPGGLLRYGVGRFDLDEEVLDNEIGHILQLGVRLHTSSPVKGKRGIERLLDKGFSAVLVCTGAQLGLGLPIPEWKTVKGTCDVVNFTRKAKTGMVTKMDGPTLVTGSTVAAVTAARTAVRLGSEPVTLVMSRNRSEAPAGARNLSRAEAEGVRILDETMVTGLEGTGSLDAVHLAPVRLTHPDKVRRRRVSGPMKSKQWTEPAKYLVAAGPRLVKTQWMNGTPVQVGPMGNILCRPGSHRIGPQWLFGAGEAVTGPKTVVEALASGIAAAREIDAYLSRLAQQGRDSERQP